GGVESSGGVPLRRDRPRRTAAAAEPPGGSVTSGRPPAGPLGARAALRSVRGGPRRPVRSLPRAAVTCGELWLMRLARVAASIAAALCVVACGSSATGGSGGGTDTSLGLHAHPQAVEPTAGAAAQSYGGETAAPVGDPNA